MDEFITLVNEDNIFNVIESLGLEKTNTEIYISGMHTENFKTDLKLVLLYYNDKEKILDILDLFNIEYDESLRYFQLPRDYTKDKIEKIMSNIYRTIISTNSCYLKDNFGFWLEGNVEKEVPLQEVFMNKYIKDYVNLIMSILKEDKYRKYSYLFEVTHYQDFSKDTILELAKCLPSYNMFSKYHDEFVKRHKDILFNDDEFCKGYIKYASTNKYNPFNIHNFNKEYQKRFLKTLGFEQAMRLVGKLGYSEGGNIRNIKRVERG